MPRNDGTNLADYLLDNENVMDISVDANNTKWFATNGSGLYRTNADGSMILDHFTTANSDIISDNVYAVFADPGSNKVYVGTDVGVCIYHSANAPAADDYSDVYAYPNPVTPDYTGDITITGLMDKSAGQDSRCRRQRVPSDSLPREVWSHGTAVILREHA